MNDVRLCLLVAMIAFLTYANSLGNGFTLDDNSVIVNNPALKGSILALFSGIDTNSKTQLLPFYRPITYLTFLVDGRLHGFDPFFIRLFNVLLHSANAFLVFRLARSFFKDNIYAALLTALLFAVHPLQSEGVDFNAGGRNTMLACFFSIAAYLLHKKGINSKSFIYAVAGSFFFLTGLFSKETTLMILPFIIAIEAFNLRENKIGAGLQSFIRLSPYFAATVIYLLMRWQTLSKLGIQTSIIPGFGTSVLEKIYITNDLGTRLLDNIYIIPRYLQTIVWPLALSSRYMIPEDLNLLALPLSVTWLFILGCCSWLFTKGRSTISYFGVAWLVLFWLPVSGIVLVPGAPLADRFLYMPAIGLWIIIADQLFKLLPIEKRTSRKYGLAIVIILLIILATITIRRNLDWKNNIALFTRFVDQYPDNVHARVGLGKAYYISSKEQNTATAELEFEKALALDPNSPMINTYMGNIKLNKDDLDQALQYYSHALEVNPSDKEARLNRGITLDKLGRPKEAYTDYLFFLTFPGNTESIPGGQKHAEQRIKAITTDQNKR